MHKPIRDHLEAYLSSNGNSSSAGIPAEFRAHLAACSTCEEQLRVAAEQSRHFRALRDSSQLEPHAGFYARVLNRIEEQKPDTFWSVFLGPVLGGRLAYACGALVLVLGTYLVTSERNDFDQAQDIVVVSQAQPADTDGAFRSKDRDAVLVNLASFRE